MGPLRLPCSQAAEHSRVGHSYHPLMEFTSHDSAVLLGLLVAGVALVALAPVLRVPYPILLVLGGLALGLVPGVPELTLPPDLVLVGILPPLLYAAAFYTSLRELRRDAGSIGLLAVGLVLMTTVVVAGVAHWVVGLGWGAGVGPGRRRLADRPAGGDRDREPLGVPRMVSVIEGKSLINDGTALVAYRYAVIAVTTGTFSLLHASISFVFNVVGGSSSAWSSVRSSGTSASGSTTRPSR